MLRETRFECVAECQSRFTASALSVEQWSLRRSGLILCGGSSWIVLLLVMMLTVSGVSAESPRPWWTDYHTVLSHPRSKLNQAWELGAMAERSLWATGWYGPWWIQHQLQDQGPGNTRAWIQRGAPKV